MLTRCSTDSNETVKPSADQNHVLFESPPQSPQRWPDPAIDENDLDPHLGPIHPDREDSLPPIARKEPQMDSSVTEYVPQEEKDPQTDFQRDATIRLLDIFPTRARTPENKITLESVLAPAGQANVAMKAADNAELNLTPKPSALAKAARQNAMSTSDADLKEVIREVLSRASIPDPHNQGSNGTAAADGRTRLASSYFSEQTDRIKAAGSPCSETDSLESRELKQAEEILKTIRNLGYIVQKETTQPAKHNSGSSSSNTSGKFVTCNRCDRFRGRPCELTYVPLSILYNTLI